MGQSTSRLTYGVVPSDINDLTYRHFHNVDPVRPDRDEAAVVSPGALGCRAPVQHLRGPGLPLELWEAVIDYLATPFDRQSMLAYALVCRGWLSRSRFHLFHSVHLRTARQIRRLNKTLDKDPVLQSLVTELSLCVDDETAKAFGLLLDLLSRLPQVVEMNFASFLLYPKGVMLKDKHRLVRESVNRWSRRKWRDIHRSPMVEFPLFGPVAPSATSSISTLCLCKIKFQAFSDFGWGLCALPNLLNLTCSNVRWRSAAFNPLSLDAYRDTALKRLLVLKIFHGTANDDGLRYIFDAVGTSLQTIVVCHDVVGIPEVQARCNLDLRRFSSLITIDLGVWFYSEQSNNTWLPIILESITSDNIQTVHLSFNCGKSLTRSQALNSIPFSRLDDILIRRQYEKVKKFTFYLNDDSILWRYWDAQLAWRMNKLWNKANASVSVEKREKGETWLGF